VKDFLTDSHNNFGDVSEINYPEQSANARLIAAAPELLQAATAAIAALSQNKTFPADIAAAKTWLSAAIAHATGDA